MAVYRKQPTVFNVPSKPQRQSQSFVPFSGLEINDNPLLNTQSSASDMLNMVVDDNYFLTLRPRLEKDEAFEKAVLLANELFIYNWNEISHTIIDALYIKGFYFFIFEYTEDNAVLYAWIFTDGKDITHTSTTATDDMINHPELYMSFDDFAISVESNVFRFVHKITGTHLLITRGNNVLFTTDQNIHVPTYKANIISKDTLRSAPIYEDLNIISPDYKIGFQFTGANEETLKILRQNATSINGNPYVLKELVDLASTEGNISLLVYLDDGAGGYTMSNLNRLRSSDKSSGGKVYYAWYQSAAQTVWYSISQFLIPGTILYTYANNNFTPQGYSRIRYVEIVSRPSINRSDILRVENDDIYYVDGGKAEEVMYTAPHKFKWTISSTWFNRFPSSDVRLGITTWFAWKETPGSTIRYTANPYFIYYGSNVYAYSGGTMNPDGSVFDLDWPIDMSIPFYKVNTLTHLSHEFFRLYVEKPGPVGQYVSRSEFSKLFSTEIEYDNNSNRIGKFFYDVASKALVRVVIPTIPQLPRTARNGGDAYYDTSSSYTQNIIKEVDVLVFPISENETSIKSLKLDPAAYDTQIANLGPGKDYNRWRIHYFDGQVIVAFDGTFLGIPGRQLGLGVFKTSTDIVSANFSKFFPVHSSTTVNYSGGNTLITLLTPINSVTTSTQYEVFSQIIWNGADVFIVSPYMLSVLTSIGNAGPYTLDGTTATSAKMMIYVNGSYSYSNLNQLSTKTLSTNRKNGYTLNGSQLVLFSVDNATGNIKPDVIVLSLVAISSSRGYTLPLFDELNRAITMKAININVSGNLSVIQQRSAWSYNYATYILDLSNNNNIVSYSTFDIYTGLSSSLFFNYKDNFAAVYPSGKISTLEINEMPIEFTYSISDNESNPYKIDATAISEYNKARTAYYNQNYPFINTTYAGESKVYYKENYIFITAPNMFDYLPVVYSHQPQQKVRHASPYLQQIVAVFEQNMIEFLTMVENPFITTNYISFAYMPAFTKYEQLAIDYTDTKHLVTFFGNTVYLNSGGLYSMTFEPNTSQDDVRKATLVSKAVNQKLTREDMSKAILANSDPYVLLMFPNSVTGKTNVYAFRGDYGHWYYWELPIVVMNVQDDNLYLRLKYEKDGVFHLAYLTDRPILIDVDESKTTYEGSVERYLDLDEKVIPWFWKSQLLSMGTLTKQKQLIETYFTFVNKNAGITIDTDDSFDVTARKITSQSFGIRYFTYNDIVTVSPKVEYEDKLNIINNIRQRTYLSRFNYCQLLCYNIDMSNDITDKVRLANIVMIYKYLTGGK